MNVNIIASVATNRAIGKDNALLWHLRDDMRRFARLTKGHPVIMGHRTFRSLPKGALPLRVNIVLSRTVRELPGCVVVPSLDAALDYCRQHLIYNNVETPAIDFSEVFIIGGESVYAEALPVATRLHLTWVPGRPEAHAFFPKFDVRQWRHVSEERHEGFAFVDYERLT